MVNLLVSPEQAEVLSLASNHTQIQLVLRNPLDTNVSEVPGSAMANLFAGGDAPVKEGRGSLTKLAHKAPRMISVEILNGTQRSEQKFPVPEESE